MPTAEFAETGPSHATLVPGIAGVLEELTRDDVASAIATGKSRVGGALMPERLGVAGLVVPSSATMTGREEAAAGDGAPRL